MDIQVGDLVVCSAKAFREQARLGLDVGLFLVERKRDGLVFFARPDRSEWIPKAFLKPVTADDARVVPPPPWIATLHEVVRLLEATDLTLEREEGFFEVRVGTLGLDRPLLDRLESLIGTASDLQIRPGSMSRVLVVYRISEQAVSRS